MDTNTYRRWHFHRILEFCCGREEIESYWRARRPTQYVVADGVEPISAGRTPTLTRLGAATFPAAATPVLRVLAFI